MTLRTVSALSTRQRVTLLLGACLMWWLAAGELTGSAVTKDSGENLRLALNLAHHGVMSLDEAPPYHPSMMREPVPAGVLAVAVHIADDLLGGEQESDSYFSGPTARYLKFTNLLWLTVLTACTFLAIRHFTASFSIALLGSVLVALHFTWWVPSASRQLVGVDNLDTELAGAALLTGSCLLLATGVARRSPLMMAFAGLVFGLAALTKASLFYVCIGELAAFAAYYAIVILSKRADATALAAAMFGSLTLGFMLVTMPWLYRNYAQTGYIQIAERSGSVLLHRALLDQMTAREYGGAFAVWGEPHVCRIISAFTGFTVADLEAGGRLQRLSENFSGAAQQREVMAERLGHPDAAVTWYRKARATYEANLAQFTRAGSFYASGAADLATRAEAVHIIAQHPLKHAAVMPLLLWRGASVIFLVLVVAFVHAVRCGRTDVVLFVLPAIGLAGFYSAASQFAPRFGYVIYPDGVIALLTVAASAWLRRGSSLQLPHWLAGRNI